MKEIERLIEIVQILRSESGCPWDREQTLYSMKSAILEEAAELVDALDNKDIENIREELGDVLLHVVMHSQMAADEKMFNINAVAKGICDKLIRRHPHVFGNEDIDNANAVIKRWDAIKLEEKKDKPKQSILDSVPENLTSLVKAQKIQHKAAKTGFDWKDISDVFAKLDEETAELKEAHKSGNKEHMSEELGDMLFVMANLARHMGCDADEALRGTIRKFKKRFAYLEQEMEKDGKPLGTATLAEMDVYWNEAKKKV